MRSMVAGYGQVIATPRARLFLPFTLMTTRAYPTTSFGGPPPRTGEELRLAAAPAKARGL